MVGIPNPFPRIARPVLGHGYFDKRTYIRHPAYADAPHNYVQAFLLLQDDLKRLFQYVEPAEKNHECYSFRIHEILLRACIEVEANCKAILSANGYAKSGNWNRNDYRLIESSHRLSEWKVRIPHWNGSDAERQPFAAWAPSAVGTKLKWYDDYNESKHDRHVNFQKAAFSSAVDAVCGALVLLSAQFTDDDFNPTSSVWGNGTVNGWRAGIGSYFMVSYPNWSDAESYNFDWHATGVPPFKQYPYPYP